jgi:hypothetical protein
VPSLGALSSVAGAATVVVFCSWVGARQVQRKDPGVSLQHGGVHGAPSPGALRARLPGTVSARGSMHASEVWQLSGAAVVPSCPGPRGCLPDAAVAQIG